MFTMRFDEDNRGFTIKDAPGGTVHFAITRQDEHGRLWYRVSRGSVMLEPEVVEGSPLRPILAELEAVERVK